jgi:hypothetical protein
MKLGSGGTQGKYSEGRRLLICTPRCVPLLLKAKPVTRFRERLLAGPVRDGVPLEYVSLPTKTSSSQTSSTTPSRHPAINHNCPLQPYIFILLPRMAVRRVPDLPCTFVFLRHVLLRRWPLCVVQQRLLGTSLRCPIYRGAPASTNSPRTLPFLLPLHSDPKVL